MPHTPPRSPSSPGRRTSRDPRRCTVTAVERLTPRMTRVRLRSDALVGVEPVGPDQRATLLFPTAGQFTGDPEEIATMRRRRRTYTLLNLDPEHGSVDIDFALHGEGVAAGWARAAQPGHELDLVGPTGRWHLDPDARSWLLVADETGLPALEAILGTVPEQASVEVHVEIADDAERRTLPQRDGIDITWWSREGTDAAPGDLLAALGPHLRIGAADAVAWVAAEAAAVSALRQHLQAERGLHRRRVSATPYWRAGTDGS